MNIKRTHRLSIGGTTVPFNEIEKVEIE